MLKKYILIRYFNYEKYPIPNLDEYNQVAFPYLMAHWGNLPVPSLPNY